MEALLGAALVILGTQLAWVSGQMKLEQHPPFLRAQERESPTLYCNSSSTIYTLLWYRQDPQKGPEVLVTLTSPNEVKPQGRLTARFGEKRQNSSLFIKDSQPGDSAIYFCAGRTPPLDGNSPLVFGGGTTVRVKPNVTNPQPRMYHLKKPRVNDLSVCLFTDFGNEEVNMMGINNIKRTPSMVAEKRLASMSLGIVAWNNNLDWKCQAEVSNITYSLSNSSGKVCNTTAVTENFSSDPYLNSINLAMIFLRVIFVKTVGFNLLMTLKLWSS